MDAFLPRSLLPQGFDATNHMDYLFTTQNLYSREVVLNGKQLDTSGEEVSTASDGALLCGGGVMLSSSS